MAFASNERIVPGKIWDILGDLPYQIVWVWDKIWDWEEYHIFEKIRVRDVNGILVELSHGIG